VNQFTARRDIVFLCAVPGLDPPAYTPVPYYQVPDTGQASATVLWPFSWVQLYRVCETFH